MITLLPAGSPRSLVVATLATISGAIPAAAWGQTTSSASAPAALPPPVPLLVPQPAARPAAPAQMVGVPNMLTDTPEYCASLSDRVGDMARDVKVSAEAVDLAREGQRLCEDGKTRSGVQYLRRAFILLRQTSAER